MAVDNTDVIDFVSINQQGVVSLTISDHLEWDSENEHLLLLQDKINAYLVAIESGEIYESYLSAVGKEFEIRVVVKYSPDKTALEFFEKVRIYLLSRGYGFRYYQL